ncbi:lasso peptide biosynthesis PqqD family chaperone [Microbacterium betulae]|uniref:Lasso peptide biosynthesis PqqD family chaperone n=1 Tax=Microbacterium betulae TaxID=2981139 RepID=A0AA97FFX3_9MICO|nr:lasso peptide biosynthesis PqqD family chaperone [Microbacterium sp. AB]WOF21918.1 lasso peptide biosynthesis PqqD family chaperone [Microbacterium sp. AB]
MTNTPETRNPSLHRVSTEYGDVILNERTGAYWHLNESASRVVAVLDSGGSVEDAVRDLVDVYEIDEVRARQDIEVISASLQKLGAL